jgi:hypothetical protein
VRGGGARRFSRAWTSRCCQAGASPWP